MCGINGILRLRANAPPSGATSCSQTRDHMRPRGPDGAGEWFSPSGEIALAHRRLAIIDLSPTGLQPMSWAGRYWIVFNGEIYNYRELRSELERDGAVFRSTSDTEVILALYEREEEHLFPCLRGMYAFALWDDSKHQLVLARDPYGIKPLYYSITDGLLRFASQVKALEASGAVSKAVDPGGLVGFLLWGSVPEPFTIREAVRALPAGHFLTVREGSVGAPKPHYRFDAEPTSAETDVPAAVEASIRAHLVADVPVGVFLSAGLDSAMIAAVAARALPEPPTTLTVRFDAYLGSTADEGPPAAEVASTLGTNHIEHTVNRRAFLDLWPQALAAMDQPSIDGFNTFPDLVHRRPARVEGGPLGPRRRRTLRQLSLLQPSAALGARHAKREVRARPAPAMAACGSVACAQSSRRLVGCLTLPGTLPGAYFLRRGLFLPRKSPR